MTKSERMRRQMVRELEKQKLVTSDAVRDAFLAVPREVFVPQVLASRGLDGIYGNIQEPLVTKTDSRGQAISSSSAPSIMAVMLEQLDVRPGHRVLEIGAGTGYNAALLKRIVGPRGRVTAVDIDSDTVSRAQRALRSTKHSVRVVQRNGLKGFRPDGPYDRIIATVGVDSIPRAWFNQLKRGGRVEAPLRLRAHGYGPQFAIAFEKERDDLRSVAVSLAGFMRVRPSDGADSPPVTYLSVGMTLRKSRAVAAASGYAVERLTDAGRRRLAGLMTQQPRRETIFRGTVDAVGGLVLYVTLATHAKERHEGGGWWSSGVIGPDARSVALVARGGLSDGRSSAVLSSLGSKTAERRLRSLVAEWHDAGRPSWRDLEMRIRYDGRRTRAWRSERNGDSIVSFDWSLRSEPS